MSPDAGDAFSPRQAVPAETGQSDGLPIPARYWAAASVCVALFITVLDSSIANVALPTIARDFGARPAASIWIVNAYQLAIVVSLLPFASLGEKIGFKRLYLAGLSVFTLASLACTLSRDLETLAAARALQGLGAAGAMSVNGGLLRFIWPNDRLGRGIGLNALVISVSAVAAPSLASAILAVGPWPWLFAINIPLGLIALALAARTLPPNPLSQKPFDLLSALLNAAAFGFLISGVDLLTRTRAWGMGAVQAALGLVFGGVLARREWRRSEPLVPFDLLRNPQFAWSVATSIASFAAQLLAFVSLPFRFETSLGFSQVTTGLLMTPWPAAVGLCAPLSGWLSDRLSAARLCAAGLAILSLGLGALASLGSHPGFWDIAWRMALCGAGFGLYQSPNNRVMLSSAPRDRAGAAGGMLGTARLTGQTTGALITAVLFEAFGARGQVLSLWTAAAMALTAAAFSLQRQAETGASPR